MDGRHALQQTIVHRILEKLVKEIWQSQRMKIYMAQRRDIPHFSGSIHRAEDTLAQRPLGSTADLVAICGAEECGRAWQVMTTTLPQSRQSTYTRYKRSVHTISGNIFIEAKNILPLAVGKVSLSTSIRISSTSCSQDSLCS